jgi:delta24-sterol reductase
VALCARLLNRRGIVGALRRKSYDALRAKFSATYLPSVHDKVNVDFNAEEEAINASWVSWLLAVFWPMRGPFGVYKAIAGGDYLLQRTRSQALEAPKDKSA